MTTAVELDVKVCGHCREEQPAAAFARNRSRPDGRAGWCRACVKVKQPGQRRRRQERLTVGRITRISSTLYELELDGEPAGNGNTLHAARIRAERLRPGLDWRRPRHDAGLWIGRTERPSYATKESA